MKRKIFTLLVGVTIFFNGMAQSISPAQTDEYCPGTEYTFTVTLPGLGYGFPNVFGYIVGTGDLGIVTAGPYNINTTSGNTVFNFRGKFSDINNSQSFRVEVLLTGVTKDYDFTYSKIKSFSSGQTVSRPQPSPSPINAPRCQSQNINITFPAVQYANPFTTPVLIYGTITTFEYRLPQGWSLNGITSTGSNWIQGSNNVTVTTDLCSGDGGYVTVHAVNPCGAGLSTGPDQSILVSRPAPVLTIAPVTDEVICSTPKSFTISGMPSGSTVSWSVSNPSQASITSGGTSPTVTVSRIGSAIGIITLTATVTDCCFTYTSTYQVSLGSVSPNPIEAVLVDPLIGRIQVRSEPLVPGTTGYKWYKDGVWALPWNGYSSSFAQIPIQRRVCGVSYEISVTSTSACGVSAPTYLNVYVDPSFCGAGNDFIVYPNPTSGVVTISTETKTGVQATDKTIDEIRIFDLQGNLKKDQKYSKAKQATLDISGLPEGTYFIIVVKGVVAEKHQLIIRK